jgi:regulator of protease activity HflC (stomatin/prohibitin superfamily)
MLPEETMTDNYVFLMVAILLNILPAGVMLWLVVWLGARFMATVYGLSSAQEARDYLSKTLFGGSRQGGPLVTVSEAEVVGGRQPPTVRLGGPGKLKVHNDSAVLLEQAGRLTRVVGPGVHSLDRLEKIREIIDLRPRWHPLTVEGMSREGIPVRCTVEIHYQINDKGRGAHLATREQPYAYSEEAVFRAATGTWLRELESGDHLDWGARIAGSAEGTLRTIMARFPLDRLIQPLEEVSGSEGEAQDSGPPPRQAIQQELEATLRDNAAEHGAKILGVALQNIELDDPVAQQWIETWRAEWEKRRREELALAKAERERQLARVKAEAQKEMILAIVDGFQTLAEDSKPISGNVVLLRFLETFEQVVCSPRAFSLLPNTDRMMNTLQTLHGMIESGSEE